MILSWVSSHFEAIKIPLTVFQMNGRSIWVLIHRSKSESQDVQCFYNKQDLMKAIISSSRFRIGFELVS